MKVLILVVAIASTGLTVVADPPLDKIAEAREVLRLVEKCVDEVSPGEQREELLGELAEGYAALDDLVAMNRTLERMAAGKSKTSALGSVATKLAGRDNPAEAQKLADRIEDNAVVRGRTQAEVARAFAKRGELTTALKIAESITGEEEYIHIDLRSTALAQIAAAHIKTGNSREADRVVGLIEEKHRNRVWSVAPVACAEVARGNVKSALARAELVEPNERIGVKCQIADAMAKAGDKKPAQQLLQKLFDEAIVAPKSSAHKMFGSPAHNALQIVEAQARSGDTDGAAKNYEQLVARCKRDQYEGEIWIEPGQLVDSFMNHGRKETIVKLIDLWTDRPNCRAAAYCELAVWEKKIGRSADARESLDKVLGLADEKKLELVASFKSVLALGAVMTLADAEALLRKYGDDFLWDNGPKVSDVGLMFIARSHTKYQSAQATRDWALKRDSPHTRGQCLLGVFAALTESLDEPKSPGADAVP